MTASVLPSPRRVVLVSGFYPPHLGGVEGVTQSLGQALVRRGHDVSVLTTNCGAGGATGEAVEDGLLVRRRRGVECAHTPVAPTLVADLCRVPRDAVLHVQVAQAFLPEAVRAVCAVRRRPYLLHYHLDVDSTGRLGWLLPTYKRLVLAAALRAARAVMVLSSEQAEFVAVEHGVARERLHVVPNGVGEELFEVGSRRPPPRAGSTLRLLFLGRLSAQKNVARLIDAVRLLDVPVELAIVGDGDQRDLLERRAAATNAPVRFLGVRRGPALHELLAWADLFVLPSDKEGMPLAVLEAMAAGLPVLATDVPGSREIVGGVGLLVEPTPGGVAAGIARLGGDLGERARMSAAGRHAARAFSWDRSAAVVETVYDRALGARSGA